MDISELKKLYEDGSKHSIYQNIPLFVSERIGYEVNINEEWRGDKTRLDYIEKVLSDIEFNSLGDIGANTGYFSLIIADIYKKSKILAYEINSNHCEFINLIKSEFNISNIEVINEGVNLNKVRDLKYRDIYIFLNVLHHAGIDFDKELDITINNFEVYSYEFLKYLTERCKMLIFQMGYNHGGNKDTPIVSSSKIYEMLIYQINILKKSGWDIIDIAYADNNRKEYRSLIKEQFDIWNIYNEKNEMIFNRYLNKYYIDRNSEFYKRPIFILESKNL